MYIEYSSLGVVFEKRGVMDKKSVIKTIVNYFWGNLWIEKYLNIFGNIILSSDNKLLS